MNPREIMHASKSYGSLKQSQRKSKRNPEEIRQNLSWSPKESLRKSERFLKEAPKKPRGNPEELLIADLRLPVQLKPRKSTEESSSWEETQR